MRGTSGLGEAHSRSHHRGSGAAGRLLVLILLATVAGASGPRTESDLVWPADSPRIRLERVLTTRRDLGKGSFLRFLTGRRDSALFQRPYGAAWQGDRLLITDPGKGRVLAVDLNRRRVLSSPAEVFRSPIGVAACPGGVVVSDSVAGRVALLDRALHLVRWIARDLERPTGVACIGDRIFVVETGRHRVLAIEPQGWLADVATALTRPLKTRGLIVLPVPDRSRVLILDPDRVTRVLGTRGSGLGEFNFPTAMTLGADALWVGDTLNFRLQRFDPVTGEFLGKFGTLGDAPGELPRLKGMAFDSRSRLWISDAYLDQVALFRTDGTFLMSFGGPGSRPGEFSFPAGIAAHEDGRMAVVDSLNRRVKVFAPVLPAAAGAR